MASRIARQDFTEHISESELYYLNKVQPKEDGFTVTEWRQSADQRRAVFPELINEVTFKGRILELGCGSAWLTGELSKLEEVEDLYCFDASEAILKNITPYIFTHINADTDKITRVIGDFHKLSFDDNYFDFIVFDDALHRIPKNSYGLIFRELSRVLKPGGKIVAVHEPVLLSVPLMSWYQKRKLPETRWGEQNLYTKTGWHQIFNKFNLKASFNPVTSFFKKLGPLQELFHFVFPTDYILLLEKD
ncbi:MAG: class I SAM-dependent methyltransferase [Candidatus Nanoarchaeia archaeon]